MSATRAKNELPPYAWNSPTTWGFLAEHLIAAVTVIVVIVFAIRGEAIISGEVWILFFVLWITRSFFVAFGYHRYFSHRSFEFHPKIERPATFLVALFCALTGQKGVIWWARTHRDHHKYSDKLGDPHSPILYGFFESHIGWILRRNPPESPAKDWESRPELVWLDKWHLLPFASLGALCFFLYGLEGLLVGFFVSTIWLFHCTATINSLSHLIGSRRYETNDQSRNFWLLILFVIFGEQHHNNHHHNQISARQGEKWWEIDLAYYAIIALYRLRIISKVKLGRGKVLQR